MSKAKEFKSTLKVFFMAYIEGQKSKRLYTEVLRGNLMSFDEYLIKANYEGVNISKEIYDGWLSTQSDLSRLTVYSKVSSVRRVLIYINSLGYDCYIPRPQKCPHCDYVPYIYTEADIRNLFKAADEWRDIMVVSTACVLVMPTLLRLLYSTGIRISEALALNNSDVDFEHHILHLHDTKNRCDRLSPINSSMEQVLRQYIHFRNQMPIDGLCYPDAPLFITLQGKRCKYGSVLSRFKDILIRAGIPVAPNGYLPRIHDLRHSACVHAMVKLVEGGKDIYCVLPILSAFMGHRKPESTEYYVRLTQEMYPSIIKQDMSVTSSIKSLIGKIAKQSDNEHI